MTKRPRVQQRAPTSGTKEGQRSRAALGVAKRRLRELGEERRATRLELAKLRRIVAGQEKQLEALTSKVEAVTNREEELRAMLLGAHDQLMRRAEQVRADLMADLQRSVAQERAAASRPAPEPVPAVISSEDQNPALGTQIDYEQLSKYFAYRRLVNRVREVVNAVLPSDATVAVVSKGDQELLELGGRRRGWHFPQNEEGAYAGYYPADSAEAIAHLEELREKGASFLLFPQTAFWWLESYEEFGEHLNTRYRRVWGDEEYAIYELAESAEGGDPTEDGDPP